MDRNTFDIRLLLHTLDTFFERIIVALPPEPAKTNLPLKDQAERAF